MAHLRTTLRPIWMALHNINNSAKQRCGWMDDGTLQKPHITKMIHKTEIRKSHENSQKVVNSLPENCKRKIVEFVSLATGWWRKKSRTKEKSEHHTENEIKIPGEQFYFFVRCTAMVRKLWNWNLRLLTNSCLLQKSLETRMLKLRLYSTIAVVNGCLVSLSYTRTHIHTRHCRRYEKRESNNQEFMIRIQRRHTLTHRKRKCRLLLNCCEQHEVNGNGRQSKPNQPSNATNNNKDAGLDRKQRR